MWGTKASMYSEKANRAGSMKWHLVYEDSIEDRLIEIGWGPHKQEVPRQYGYLNCGRKNTLPSEHHYKMPLVLKDTINVMRNNVCAHCRNARLKELDKETKIEA